MLHVHALNARHPWGGGLVLKTAQRFLLAVLQSLLNQGFLSFVQVAVEFGTHSSAVSCKICV